MSSPVFKLRRYQNATNVQRTLDVVRQIAQKYTMPAYSDVVTMIELINEPSLWVSDQFKVVLKQYYLDAYDIVRNPWGQFGMETETIVLLQDGFQPMSWWGDFMTPNFNGGNYKAVWMDNHYYQGESRSIFGQDLADSRLAFTDYYGQLDAAGHINVRRLKLLRFVD